MEARALSFAALAYLATEFFPCFDIMEGDLLSYLSGVFYVLSRRSL